MPPAITAATGIDALTHCVEAYTATGLHPRGLRVLWRDVALRGRHCVGTSRRFVRVGVGMEPWRLRVVYAQLRGTRVRQRRLWRLVRQRPDLRRLWTVHR